MAEPRPERDHGGRSATLWLAAIAIALIVGFLPGWWERHLFHDLEVLRGVGASIHPGTLAEARRKVDPGRTAQQIVAALGRPSLTTSTEGLSPRQVWTYYYGDGTMVLNMTDGIAQRIALTFGPPKIPTSRRAP